MEILCSGFCLLRKGKFQKQLLSHTPSFVHSHPRDRIQGCVYAKHAQFQRAHTSSPSLVHSRRCSPSEPLGPHPLDEGLQARALLRIHISAKNCLILSVQVTSVILGSALLLALSSVTASSHVSPSELETCRAVR